MVIPNEKDMTDFIRVLIHNLDTLNGIRGTLGQYYKMEAKLKGLKNKPLGTERRLKAVRGMCFKYTLMKIRNKISYMAFLKRNTVQELLCNAILNSFNELVKWKEVTPRKMDMVFDDEDVFANIKQKSITNVLKLVMKINSMNFKENWNIADELELDRAREYIFNNKKDVVYIRKKNGRMEVKEIDHARNMQTIAQI